jgi:hypothetical protein
MYVTINDIEQDGIPRGGQWSNELYIGSLVAAIGEEPGGRPRYTQRFFKRPPFGHHAACLCITNPSNLDYNRPVVAGSRLAQGCSMLWNR